MVSVPIETTVMSIFVDNWIEESSIGMRLASLIFFCAVLWIAYLDERPTAAVGLKRRYPHHGHLKNIQKTQQQTQ